MDPLLMSFAERSTAVPVFPSRYDPSRDVSVAPTPPRDVLVLAPHPSVLMETFTRTEGEPVDE